MFPVLARRYYSCMSLIATEAIVLQTFPYSETSKIARLVTRDLGVVSVVAKGARRARSKFGASLQLLSDGTAQLYFKANRDLHTLTEFDPERQRHGLTRDVSRFAAAAALAELMIRCSPQQPHPEIFETVRAALDLLEHVPSGEVGVVGLMAMWRTVNALGFAPSLDTCVIDGAALGDVNVEFSINEGGFVCSRCAPSRETSKLPMEDRRALVSFIQGKAPTGGVSPRHLAAHRRLCARFIKRHVAEGREFKALDFWEAGAA